MTLHRNAAWRFVLILGVLSGLLAPGIAKAQDAVVPVFRVGDAVRITVWERAEFSGQFDIGEAGTVIHPIYQAIRLAGLTQPQAEAEFRRVLQQFYGDPRFVIEPLFRITVAGEVVAPNIYTLPSHATLVQALTEAGGPTTLADLRRVRLFRDGQEIDLDLRQPDNEAARTRIRSGDQIIVGRTTSLWRDHIEPTIRTVGSLSSIAYFVIRIATGSR